MSWCSYVYKLDKEKNVIGGFCAVIEDTIWFHFTRLTFVMSQLIMQLISILSSTKRSLGFLWHANIYLTAVDVAASRRPANRRRLISKSTSFCHVLSPRACARTHKPALARADSSAIFNHLQRCRSHHKTTPGDRAQPQPQALAAELQTTFGTDAIRNG